MPDSLDPWNANPGRGYEPAEEVPLGGGNQPLAVPGSTVQAGSLNLSMPTDNEVDAWAASARQEMGGNHLLAGGIASDIQQPSQSHWPEGLGTSNDDLYTGIDSEAHDAPMAGNGTHAGPSGGGSTSSATTGSVLQNAGDEATSPGGTHYTAKSGLELKTGGMAGVSDDNKRFLLPSRETGYDYANPKSQPTEDQRNGMRELISGVRGKKNASIALGKGSSALSIYQKNHAPDLINPKRSAGIQQAKANMGAEGRSAAAQKAKATLGAEGLSAAALKRGATLGAAGRSAASRKANETMAINSGRAFRIDDPLTGSATQPPAAGSSVKRPAPSTDTSEEPSSKRPRLIDGPASSSGTGAPPEFEEGSSSRPLEQAGPSRSGRSAVAGPVQVDEETENSILERFNSGMDPAEIASELNLPPETVNDVLKPYRG